MVRKDLLGPKRYTRSKGIVLHSADPCSVPGTMASRTQLGVTPEQSEVSPEHRLGVDQKAKQRSPKGVFYTQYGLKDRLRRNKKTSVSKWPEVFFPSVLLRFALLLSVPGSNSGLTLPSMHLTSKPPLSPYVQSFGKKFNVGNHRAVRGEGKGRKEGTFSQRAEGFTL